MTGIEAGTLAIISLASTAVGTGLEIIGGIQQSKAQAQAARYQAQVARNNEIIARRQAEDARQRGEIEARRQRQRSNLLQGDVRSKIAGAGVLVDELSAQKEIEDVAAAGELDALTIRSNAEREALGFETRGMNFAAEAGLQSATASNISSSIPVQAGATLLTGAGSVASKWHAFKTEGAIS